MPKGRNPRWSAIPVSFIMMIALLAAMAGPARATEKTAAPSGNLIYILDGSGSMWGQVDGKAKIAVAREALALHFRELPEGLDVSLVAFGHRRKGDCDDVERLIPLGKLNRKKLIEKVNTLSPKGKAPITLSILRTAGRLGTLKDETTIILIADGEDSCKGDPCTLVGELRKGGANFSMHVIGLHVPEEERAQLECIARAGGGAYHAVGNADELRMAVKAAVQETQTLDFRKLLDLGDSEKDHVVVEKFKEHILNNEALQPLFAKIRTLDRKTVIIAGAVGLILLILILKGYFLVKSGELMVVIDQESSDEDVETFFCIKVSKKSNEDLTKIKNRLKSEIERKKKYSRRAKIGSKYEKSMVARTALFKWLPSRKYHVYLYGIIMSRFGKDQIGNYQMSQPVAVKMGRRANMTFDLAPKTSYVEFFVYDGTAIAHMAEVYVKEKGVGKYQKDGDQGVFFYLEPGEYTIFVRYGEKELIETIHVPERNDNYMFTFNMKEED